MIAPAVVVKLNVVAVTPVTLSTLPKSIASASVNVTVCPESLIDNTPTFVVAAVKLIVPPAVNAKFVSTIPPKVPVIVLFVNNLNMAVFAGLKSALTVIAPAFVLSPIRNVVAVIASSSVSVNSNVSATAPFVPKLIASPTVFDFNTTVWPVAVTVPLISISSAVIVNVPLVELKISPPVNVKAPLSLVTVMFVAPPEVRFSSNVKLFVTSISTWPCAVIAAFCVNVPASILIASIKLLPPTAPPIVNTPLPAFTVKSLADPLPDTVLANVTSPVPDINVVSALNVTVSLKIILPLLFEVLIGVPATLNVVGSWKVKLALLSDVTVCAPLTVIMLPFV